MTKKYTYTLTINNGASQKAHSCSFDYGRSKNISLKISDKGITITYYGTVAYQSIDTDKKGAKKDGLINLLQEAVRRSVLIYMLKFGKCIKINAAILKALTPAGKEIFNDDVKNYFELYYLSLSNTIKDISSQLKEDSVINEIMKIRKSDFDSEISALYAYLLAKSDEKETDRFQHYWMAFNGLYNTTKNSAKDGESQKINIFLSKIDENYSLITQNQRNKIYQRMLIVAKNIDIVINKASFKKSSKAIGQLLKKYFSEELKSEKDVLTKICNNPYAFFLADFTYALRCNLFHANKPMLFFSFRTEPEYKALLVANSLLEECLDEHLHKIFDRTWNNTKGDNVE